MDGPPSSRLRPRSMSLIESQAPKQLVTTANKSKTATTPQYNKFTMFPKLSPELRLKVWEEAAVIPRVIVLQLHPCSCGGDFHFTLDPKTPPVPAVVHASSEARVATSKNYNALFQACVVDNHKIHHRTPDAERLVDAHPKLGISSVDCLYVQEQSYDPVSYFTKKLRLFPFDMKHELIHSIAFDCAMLRVRSTRKYIWCSIWALNVTNVILVQRQPDNMAGKKEKVKKTKKKVYDDLRFVDLDPAEVDASSQQKLAKFLRNEAPNHPKLLDFISFFGASNQLRPLEGFQVPAFKIMGVTNNGVRL